MTQNATIEKTKLEQGDYIAVEYASSDIDAPDYTVWMRVIDVVYEDGEIAYQVAFPDGEVRRGLIQASTVGRFKKALDYALDEYDYELASDIYNRLNKLTVGHGFECECKHCTRLYSMIGALRAFEESMSTAKFYERKQRLESVGRLGY